MEKVLWKDVFQHSLHVHTDTDNEDNEDNDLKDDHLKDNGKLCPIAACNSSFPRDILFVLLCEKKFM